MHSSAMLALVAFACLLSGVASQPVFCCDSNIPQQIHVAVTDDPTQVNIMWATLSVTATSTVQYGYEQDSLNMNATGFTTTYTVGGWIGTLHTVYVSALQTHTMLFYRVGDDVAGWSTTRSFVTAPPAGSQGPVRLLVIGDMGFDNSNGTITGMRNMVAPLGQTSAVDFVLHVGDISYANGVQHIWDEFFRLIDPIASMLPYMVCVGNHEAEYNFTSYKTRFTMPGLQSGSNNPDLWHSFDFGPIHFTGYSTEHPFEPGTEQYRWIEQDLAKADANRAAQPWVVVFGHRPLYCSETFNDASDCEINAPMFRGWLEPLLNKYHVDLVLAGHEHCYERMYAVVNGTVVSRDYESPTAPVYIMNGAAGGPEGLDHWFKFPTPEWSAYRKSLYGFGMLEATNSTSLTWKFYDDTNYDVVDSFTITKAPQPGN